MSEIKTDKELLEEYNLSHTIASQSKKIAHRYLVIAIAIAVVAVIACVILSVRSNTDKAAYKKEMSILREEMKGLKESFRIDSIDKETFAREITEMRSEADDTRAEIYGLRADAAQYPKKYENIPDYHRLTDDSLGRAFTKRFSY